MKKILKLLISSIVRLHYKRNGVIFSEIKALGFPKIRNKGKIFIGNNCTIKSGILFNPTFNISKTILTTEKDDSVLTIGNNVGISNTILYSAKSITIDDNVMLGAGVKVFDTDFHQIDPLDRLNGTGTIKMKSVHIKRNVFIGAGAMILKGVTIGENSVIGALSVVTKDVPENQIWAGNPARHVSDI